MPTWAKNDPRSYVKPVPPAVPSKRGLRIETRSSNKYYTSTPDPKLVWTNNYRRRQQQWTSEGFQSARDKPYRGIGDPVYLGQKPKQLILNGLGQITNVRFPVTLSTYLSNEMASGGGVSGLLFHRRTDDGRMKEGEHFS